MKNDKSKPTYAQYLANIVINILGTSNIDKIDSDILSTITSLGFESKITNQQVKNYIKSWITEESKRPELIRELMVKLYGKEETDKAIGNAFKKIAEDKNG